MDGMKMAGEQVGKWAGGQVAQPETRNSKPETPPQCDHEFAGTADGQRACIYCGWAIEALALYQQDYERMRRALDAVAAERARQRALLEEDVVRTNCAEPTVDNRDKLPVLDEGVGEVARAVQWLQRLLSSAGSVDLAPRIQRRRRHLRTELIQVAAVAVAWAESLDEDEGRPAQRGEVAP